MAPGVLLQLHSVTNNFWTFERLNFWAFETLSFSSCVLERYPFIMILPLIPVLKWDLIKERGEAPGVYALPVYQNPKDFAFIYLILQLNLFSSVKARLN